MANGDPIYFAAWDHGPDSGFDEWTAFPSAGNTQALDTGQSVPDGTARCVKIACTAIGQNYLDGYVNPYTGGTYTTGCVAFWFKGSTTETSFDTIITVYRSANSARHATLGFNSSGQIKILLWDSGTITSITGATIDTNWHYIQFAWDFSTTTGKATVAIDGTSYTEFSEAKTAAPALDVMDFGRTPASFVTNYTATTYYGGIVFSAGYYITPWRWKLRTLRPNGDKNSVWACSTGTTRYTLVDDVPMDNGTYITSSTSGAEQQFDMENVTLSAGENIAAVSRLIRGVAGTGAAGSTEYVTTSGGTSSTGTALSTITTSYGIGVPLLTAPGGSAWTDTILNGCYARFVKAATADTVNISEVSWRVAIKEPIRATLTGGLSFTAATTRLAKGALTATLSFTSAQTRFAGALISKALTATLSFTGTFSKYAVYKQALTATLSFTGNSVGNMWRQLQDAGGWFVKRGRLRRRRPY